jgi:hypothetical protein
VIRIAITHEAFDAIASTMNLCGVGYENEVNEKGERLIWLERQWCRSSITSVIPRRPLAT